MAASSQDGPVRLVLEPLTPAAFAPFGNVIANPSKTPTSEWPSVPSSTSANQGSATKYSDVTHLTNHYGLASSRKPAQPLASMFVCSPRQLSSSTLPISVLERHPYTTQTFIPMGLSPTDKDTTYLVIVAPTLPSSPPTRRGPAYPTSTPRPKSRLRAIFSRARPEPFTNSFAPASGAPTRPARQRVYDAPSPNAVDDMHPGTPLRSSFSSLAEYKARATPLTENLFAPRGTGRPDLSKARAFVAHGGQAVTYAPGTWHAPMVVVGSRAVDFVVWQWGNGVGEEDCQEVFLEKEGVRVEVHVPDGTVGGTIKAKL